MKNSQLFIQNVAAQRSRNRIETDSVDGPTPELQLSIIPNYSLFIKNLLAAYMNTIITSDEHNALKTKEFIYVTELLLSTAQGRNFDIKNVKLHNTIRNHLIQEIEHLAHSNKSINHIKIFQSMLEKETGLWYQVDLHYLDHELESLVRDYNQNDINRSS